MEFRETDASVIISGPNIFFMNWVRSHFLEEIREALAVVGCASNLELAANQDVKEQTEEEIKAREENEKAERLRKAREAEALELELRRREDAILNSLPLKEKYEKFYAAYPRHERKEYGWRIFKNMSLTNQLPRFSDLISAIKKAEKSITWNREQGRFIPAPPKWLMEQRWRD